MKTDFFAFVQELQRSHFYGSLELKFEGGRLVLIRKSETLKSVEQPYRDGNQSGN